ncbi:MAG TPA: amidohydrolase family protein [Tetrasphaera sp.]|uniref:amidohydrolase family protein n=1 Tax=Nostocoides sp. TaxID=1917966 RepID=UPI002CABBE7F|nr:amidohydrolase family protein [Tetrasphaera sp.]HNQ06770.1 amidohydrolase family protein [Tetrasphaera sp.]
MGDALRLRGPILVGPNDVRDELWVLDGRITFTAPAGESSTLDGWVVPGLTDAHCHVGLDAHGAVDAETAEAQITRDRDHGTLLIRDAGAPSDTRWIDDRPDLPKLIRAGRHIARTRRYIRDYADEVEPDQLVETVRRQARRGDGWVKIVGDWIDRATGDLTPCWPRETVAAAVAAAHEEGARMTAHCFGEAVLDDLAAAGIDCVEHASGLTAETTGAFAAQGIAIVPTMINIDNFPAIAQPAREKFPLYYAHMMAIYERRDATIAAAHEAGVPIYLGTDAGGTLSHGLAPREALRLHAAGMPAEAVLSAATWGARAWLGRPAIEEGADADLLVLPEDPRADLGVLAAPIAVILRGRVYPPG